MHKSKAKWLLMGLLLTSFQAAYASGSPYVSLQAGSYGYDSNDNPVHDIFSDFSARLSAGYLWDVSRCWAAGLEGGYQYYNKYEATSLGWTATYERHAIDVLGVLSYHLTEHFDVMGKLGGAFIFQHFALSDSVTGLSLNDNGVVPKAALALGYNATSHLQVNLSWQHEFKRNGAPSANSLLLGVSYFFR